MGLWCRIFCVFRGLVSFCLYRGVDLGVGIGGNGLTGLGDLC